MMTADRAERYGTRAQEMFDGNRPSSPPSRPTAAQPVEPYRDENVQLERWACVVAAADITSCMLAGDLADRADADVLDAYAGQVQVDSSADAVRHCYWSGLMTHHIGGESAARIAANHEAIRSVSDASATMDTHNNGIGRLLGANLANDGAIFGKCQIAASSGMLQLSP